MRRSVKLNPLFEYPTLERFWRDADGLGFHGVYTFDHLYGLQEAGADPLEAWTILAAMAAATSRIRIGCLVTAVTFRHPAMLAKMAVTVDHISGGRLDFGLGAAWHQGEHDAYGIAFPSAHPDRHARRPAQSSGRHGPRTRWITRAFLDPTRGARPPAVQQPFPW